MKKHLFKIMVLVGAIVSCQREETSVSFVDETSISVLPTENTGIKTSIELAMVALTNQTHISVEEAQELALSTAAQMREVEGILTKSPLQIASVEVVANNERKPYIATKSGKNEQGDVYIINFANNQGYVVTSADRRVPGVLAYNSYGTLSKEPDNPGQAIMFSYMQDYIEQERENFEKNKETLKTQAEEHIFTQLPKEKQKELIEKGYFDENGKRVKTKFAVNKKMPCFFPSQDTYSSIEESSGGYRRVVTVLPLLKTLWGQIGDYNDKVSVVCGSDQAAVGCVATAVGQIMAFHKKPAIFKGREMHWEDMTKIDAGDMFSNIYSNAVRWNTTAREDIQHLLARLGDNDLLDMNYGCKSGSNIGKALYTLQKLGYNQAYISGYDVYKMLSEIHHKRPVYIRGCDGLGNCHAWVIDGHIRNEYTIARIYKGNCTDETYETYETVERDLVHHNFGWGENKEELSGNYANDTGWYHIGIFNAKRNKESSNTYKSASEGNYQYGNRMIINIK